VVHNHALDSFDILAGDIGALPLPVLDFPWPVRSERLARSAVVPVYFNV
jgi:hypothetical protein